MPCEEFILRMMLRITSSAEMCVIVLAIDDCGTPLAHVAQQRCRTDARGFENDIAHGRWQDLFTVFDKVRLPPISSCRPARGTVVVAWPAGRS